MSERYRARAALKDLAAHGVDWPGRVTAAVATLDRVEATPPTAPDHNAVARLIIDDADPDTIAAAVAEHVGAIHHAQQHRLAVDMAGQRVLAAILAERDDIHAQLKALADGLIAQITAAAAVSGTLPDLIRQGNTNEAKVLADAEPAAETLRQLYDLRNTLLVPAGLSTSVNGIEGGVWEDPGLADRHYHQAPSLFQSWAAIIRAGGVLWFPTAEQAHEVAAAIAARRAEEARAAAAGQRVGLVAFG